MPETNKAGVKLYLVSIGPPPRGKEFCKLTGFPEDRLLADPENVTYSAMGFKQGFFSTFLNPKVRLLGHLHAKLSRTHLLAVAQVTIHLHQPVSAQQGCSSMLSDLLTAWFALHLHMLCLFLIAVLAGSS